MRKTEWWDFFWKVESMRESQKEYFTTRVQKYLAQAKEYEKEVDHMIEREIDRLHTLVKKEEKN